MNRKRLIILGIGVCLGAIVAVGTYLVLYPRYFSPDIRLAQQIGANPVSYEDVKAIQERARQTHQLSAEDMQRLKQLLNDKLNLIRMRALSALTGISPSSALAPEAATLIQSKLSDEDPSVRYQALRCLDHLNHQQGILAAQRMLQDPASLVRDLAYFILHNDPRGYER